MTTETAGAEPLERLVVRWRDDGDARALAALFDRTAPALFRIALSVTPDAAVAEEAVQETFVVLLEDPARCDPAQPVMPWLTGVLRHKVLDGRRRERRTPDPLALEPKLLPDDPARTAERRDAVDRVRRAIDALPEPYRSVAVLRWEYGLEPGEIAHARGEPPGTVRSTLSRALERLRKELGGVAVLGLALGVRPALGLDTVRRSVLARATVGAAASGAGVPLLVGGMLVTKAAAALVVAASALAGVAIGAATVAAVGTADTEAPATVRDSAERPGARRPAPRAARPAATPDDAKAAPSSAPAPLPADAPADADTDALARRDVDRLLATLDGRWRRSWDVGDALVQIRPERTVLARLAERWTSIAAVSDRQNLCKRFAWSDSAVRLDVLDLGARDADPRVQAWTFAYLEPYAGRHFGEEPAAYAAWRAATAGASPGSLLDASAQRLLEQVEFGPPERRAAHLRVLEDVVRRRSTGPVRDAAFDACAAWLGDPSRAGDVARVAAVAGAAEPREERARPVVERLLAAGDAGERAGLALAERLAAPWAFDAAAARLRSGDPATVAAAARVLAAVDDPRGVAPLVAAIEAHGDGAATHALAEALADLAGVPSGAGEDAAWWRAWWERNRSRFDEGRVRSGSERWPPRPRRSS